MKRILCVMVLSLSLSAAAQAAPFDDGVQALAKGDFDTARSIFEPLAAAGNGHAQFMLGVMSENGFGTRRDLAAAARWYKLSANAGVSSAQYNLALFYQLGKGVARNPAQALRWHSEAAARGHHRAQNNLGTMYYTGAGVERDPIEAWKWLTLASQGLTGEPLDVVRRNITTIENELSAGALQEARSRVAKWKVKN